jgi:hypothetical protein
MHAFRIRTCHQIGFKIENQSCRTKFGLVHSQEQYCGHHCLKKIFQFFEFFNTVNYGGDLLSNQLLPFVAFFSHEWRNYWAISEY